MVFGLPNTTKLQNDVFCLTEERDYFQAKFLEQVSEIANLKDELHQSKTEIARLRTELMEQSRSGMVPFSSSSSSPPLVPASTTGSSPTRQRPRRRKGPAPAPAGHLPEEEKKEEDDFDDASSLTHEDGPLLSPSHRPGDQLSLPSSSDEEEEDEDDEDVDSVQDIRQSAEKLLQWASYRSTMRSTRASPGTPSDRRSASFEVDSLVESLPRAIDFAEAEDTGAEPLPSQGGQV